MIAAERRGATVRWAEFDTETGELPADVFDGLISDRTRLVAVTAASNALGTKPDVRAISDRAHAAGALTYVDGVHATSHGPIDVAALGADFYVCSTYKLFGPHTGVAIADPATAGAIEAGEARPLVGRCARPFRAWHSGVRDARRRHRRDRLDLGADRRSGNRRERVLVALAAVEEHLTELLEHALQGLTEIPGVRMLGAPRRRTSTISFVIDGHHPHEVARLLGQRNISVWDGDNYAYELMHRYGRQDSGGAVRASIVLYNDRDDVDRLLEAVAEISRT